MLTDDQVRHVRDTAVLGGRVPDYSTVWEIADELLKRRHPWRPISELGEEHKGRLHLLGRDEGGCCCEIYWNPPCSSWWVLGNVTEFSNITHFMEIPELGDTQESVKQARP